MSCTPLLELVQGILVLTTATLYRVTLFIVFLSASIGPATLACTLYTYVTGREPYPEVQPAICMLLLSCWAEFSIGMEKRLCGDSLDSLRNAFPSVMSFGRFGVHFTMFSVAFYWLYYGFEIVHTYPDTHVDRHHFLTKRYPTEKSQEEKEAELKANEPLNVSLYLLALSYLVFVTSRNFHKDLLLVVRNLPSITFSMLNNWLIRIAFAVIHFCVNLFYFLPCLAIAYTSNSYKTTGISTFFQLNFTAVMAGMIAALFELNRPWPQRRARLPFLFHENNIFGKNLLAHALVVGILYFFYRPKNHPKVPQSKFDSVNHDVICYSLMVAFTTLHVVKFGVHAVLSLAHEYDNQMNVLNNVIVDMGELQQQQQQQQQNPGARAARHPPNRSNGSANRILEGGMCDRCVANAINNNFPVARPPSINQNAENSGGQPQNEARPADAHEGSASKAENEHKVNSGEAKDAQNNETTKTDTGIDQKPHRNESDTITSCDAVNEISANQNVVQFSNSKEVLSTGGESSSTKMQ